MQKRESSYSVGRNVNWCSHHGEEHAAAAKSLQSCPTPCDPIDGSPPGSPVPGILQARTLKWVAISFFNARKWKVKVKSLSRVWLLATSWTAAPPGSSVHGIFQARVLEWVALSQDLLSPFLLFTSVFPFCRKLSELQALNDLPFEPVWSLWNF